MSTQWSQGFNGPTGLRYEALYPILDRQASTNEEWESMFSDIQAMERKALSAIYEK